MGHMQMSLGLLNKDFELLNSGTEKINILMVDDNPSNLLSLESILHAPDRNLVRASSGEEALRYLLEQDAAVILLDVHMPNVDGIETAALIRGRDRMRNVPIIFLTAYDSAGATHISKGYSLGAVDYIIKPIDPEALKSKVAVFVELFRKTDQVTRQAALLREKNIELEKANIQRLSRLIDLGQQLAAERDPEQLLGKLCAEIRDILGVRYAMVAMLDEGGRTIRHFLSCGLDHEEAIRAGIPQTAHDLLREQFKFKRAARLSRADREWSDFHNFATFRPINSFLAAPILQQDEVRGWLCLADKLDAREFSEADESFAVTLSQAVVFYENARLYAEMQRHAVALEQEIAERKQAEKERAELLLREQAARREAEEANRLKDEFLATVSHELRSPLNAILGWVTLIQNDKLPEDKQLKALDTIERNARAQKKLIDDLLDVSRIITGNLRLDVQLVELYAVIESAVESIRPAAEAKGLQLRTELEPVTRQFKGDANRIQQMVWNLVSNAVKFTPPGGSVVVRLKCHDENIEIIVSDTGIGISTEFLPFVFDRFRQADGSNTRKHGGLGLGLAIVRHMVELHGGTVETESAGVGQGATFKIRLPWTMQNTGFRETEISPAATLAHLMADSATKLSGLKVLVVDDQSDARELLSTILQLSGAEVQTAGNLHEALDLLMAWRPEIIISDIAMPDGDGYDLIRKIRQLKKAGVANVPVIALTANAGMEDRIRALDAGFQLHLPKPVEPEELVVSVASLTGRLNMPQSLA
jgi:signal transduction histidine kinase/DNA-binding response OmpR family regulator